MNKNDNNNDDDEQYKNNHTSKVSDQYGENLCTPNNDKNLMIGQSYDWSGGCGVIGLHLYSMNI